MPGIKPDFVQGNISYSAKEFAHGFSVLSETAIFLYICSDVHIPESGRGILRSDPGLAVDWKLKDPAISNKGSKYPCLRDVSLEDVPIYEGSS